MSTLTRKRMPWRRLVMTDAVIELEGAFIDGLRALWQTRVDGSAEEWSEFVEWVTEVVEFTLRDNDPRAFITDD